MGAAICLFAYEMLAQLLDVDCPELLFMCLLRFLFVTGQIYTDNLAVNVLKVPHKDLLRWQPMELVCLSDSTSPGR